MDWTLLARPRGSDLTAYGLQRAMHMADAGAGQDVVSGCVTIQNERGLHARAAVRLCVLSEKYQSEIFISQETALASTKSVTDLMMLGAGPGTELCVSACGPDGEAAIAAVIALIEGRFGEEF